MLLRYLQAIPCWPQLPKRSYRENMYVQYAEGFPGINMRTNYGKCCRNRRFGIPNFLQRNLLQHMVDKTLNMALLG